MLQERNSINNLLKNFLGKTFRLQTHSGLFYECHDLEIGEKDIVFKDKFDSTIFLAISEIKKLQEVRNG